MKLFSKSTATARATASSINTLKTALRPRDPLRNRRKTAPMSTSKTTTTRIKRLNYCTHLYMHGFAGPGIPFYLLH